MIETSRCVVPKSGRCWNEFTGAIKATNKKAATAVVTVFALCVLAIIFIVVLWSNTDQILQPLFVFSLVASLIGHLAPYTPPSNWSPPASGHLFDKKNNVLVSSFSGT